MQELQELAAERGPLCVGLDTDPSYLPDSVIKAVGSKEEAVLMYNKEIIRRIASDKSACCCKVQIAYYEAMGLKGLQIYSETLKAIKEAGLIAISDIKRGDIAATADAYARAHFTGDFETDIITVNPYMGFETLKPFTAWCNSKGKGIFVLFRTSNPGMTDLEGQELKSGGLLLDRVGCELNRLEKEFKATDEFASQTCSPVGAVVGCTNEDNAAELRARHPEIFFLIPGYGAQGGGARLAATLLKNAGGTVNSSRGILCAWKKSETCMQKEKEGKLTIDDLADAAGEAALEAKNDLLGAMC